MIRLIRWVGIALGALLGLWAAVQCADCHGQDMGGKLMVDDPTLGRAYAPNLTTGEGGAAGER